MAQTKRKRRSKHRGNAVGVVEARGRTSKPREDGKRPAGRSSSSTGTRQVRPVKAPTFQSALIKAGVGGVVLFFLIRFGVLGKASTTGGALGLAAVAVVFYTPIMYLTDRAVYRRKLNPRPPRAKKKDS